MINKKILYSILIVFLILSPKIVLCDLRPPQIIFDWATVKYNSAGERQWLARKDGVKGKPGNIAADQLENLYVISDCSAIIKYDPNGNEIWNVVPHNGCYPDPDFGYLDNSYIIIDKLDYIILFNNSFVMSEDFHFVAKYDLNGALVWKVDDILFNLDNMVLDSYNNMIFTGYEDDKYSICAKYGSEGDQIWVKKFSQNEIPSINDVALDSHDNIYTTGNGFFTKYDQNGKVLWADQSVGMGVYIIPDYNDNIFLIEYSSQAYQIIKYNINGGKTRTKNINIQLISGFKLDSKGNLIIIERNNNAITTYKYDHEIDLIWERQYEFAYLAYDENYTISLAISNSDNIIIATTFDSEYLVIQYDPEGKELWANRNDNTNYMKSVTVDSSGSVYVTGYYEKNPISGKHIKKNDQGSSDGCGCSMNSIAHDGSIFVLMMAIGLIALMYGKINRR